MALFQVFWFAYLAVILLSASIWKETLWGANSWGFISQTAGFFLFLLVVAGYSWKRFGRAENLRESTAGEINTSSGEKGTRVDCGRQAAESTVKGSKARSIPFRDSALFILLFSIVLVILRSRHEFWGEVASYPSAVAAASQPALSSPVSWAVNWLAYRFLNSVLVLDPSSSSTIVSFASGVAFILVGLFLIRKLEEAAGERISLIALSFILLNGYIAVFFSGGKSSVAILFVMLFLYSSILFIEGKGSILQVTLFFILSLFSQPGTVFITVPYIYLLYLASKRSRAVGKARSVDSAALALVVVAAALLASALIKGSRPVSHISALAVASLKRTFLEGLISRTLWLDMLNELLILGPASVATLLLLFKKIPEPSGRESSPAAGNLHTFFTISAISGLLVIPLSAWRIEGGLNWHVAASAGPVLAVFTLWKVMKSFEKRYMRVIYLLALIGAFQTVPWLIINSSEETAAKRLLSLPLTPGKAEMILGENSYQKGDLDEALELLLKSDEKNPENAKTLYLLGKIYMKQDKYTDAIASFTKALEIDSTNIEYHFLLADAFIENRWLDDAILELEPLVNRYPDSARFWQRLGYACNHSGKYEKAVAAYRKALELKPDRTDYKQNLVSALINRGAELQEKKKMDAARSCYLEAIKILPIAWQAYNNLISIEIEEGNIETAEEMLKEVLKINPYAPELNLNMANLLEKKGEIEKAIDYFERSAKLNPLLPGVKEHADSLRNSLKGKD